MDTHESLDDASPANLLISRRSAIGRAVAVAASVAVAGGSAVARGQTKPTPQLLHRYEDYAWLRGFSVVPSWGARVEEAWWAYDGARFRDEVALARAVHANCIRLWIEFTAWMA